MDTINLLDEFGRIIFNFQFLWVVIATTVTMEVLKWTIFPKDMNSKWYPIHTLWVTTFFLILKSTFDTEWREFAANFVFTVMLVDVIYTYLGKYLVGIVLKVFGNILKLDKNTNSSQEDSYADKR